MIPTVEQLADGYLALIDELHWKRVAILSHNDEFYFNVCSSFVYCYHCIVADPLLAICALTNYSITIARLLKLGWIIYSRNINQSSSFNTRKLC